METNIASTDCSDKPLYLDGDKRAPFTPRHRKLLNALAAGVTVDWLARSTVYRYKKRLQYHGLLEEDPDPRRSWRITPKGFAYIQQLNERELTPKTKEKNMANKTHIMSDIPDGTSSDGEVAWGRLSEKLRTKTYLADTAEARLDPWATEKKLKLFDKRLALLNQYLSSHYPVFLGIAELLPQLKQVVLDLATRLDEEPEHSSKRKGQTQLKRWCR